MNTRDLINGLLSLVIAIAIASSSYWLALDWLTHVTDIERGLLIKALTLILGAPTIAMSVLLSFLGPFAASVLAVYITPFVLAIAIGVGMYITVKHLQSKNPKKATMFQVTVSTLTILLVLFIMLSTSSRASIYTCIEGSGIGGEIKSDDYSSLGLCTQEFLTGDVKRKGIEKVIKYCMSFPEKKSFTPSPSSHEGKYLQSISYPDFCIHQLTLSINKSSLQTVAENKIKDFALTYNIDRLQLIEKAHKEDPVGGITTSYILETPVQIKVCQLYGEFSKNTEKADLCITNLIIRVADFNPHYHPALCQAIIGRTSHIPQCSVASS